MAFALLARLEELWEAAEIGWMASVLVVKVLLAEQQVAVKRSWGPGQWMERLEAWMRGLSSETWGGQE